MSRTHLRWIGEGPGKLVAIVYRKGSNGVSVKAGLGSWMSGILPGQHGQRHYDDQQGT